MSNLFTIGHSTRELQGFFDILKRYQINYLIDVRTIPKSRRVPWFNAENLRESCLQEQIQYHHLKLLGGLRKTSKESINTGWHNHSFRGFADYMQTKPFFLGLKELNSFLVRGNRVVIMCAEAVPWRCHRSLIADAVLIRSVHVYHIFSKTSVKAHSLTPFAKILLHTRPKRIIYPDSQ
jgi:uncharacterized protein (DUF488 family)